MANCIVGIADGEDDIKRVIVTPLEQQPSAATHWSTRSMRGRPG